jgi:hypothetical protein
MRSLKPFGGLDNLPPINLWNFWPQNPRMRPELEKEKQIFNLEFGVEYRHANRDSGHYKRVV